MKLEPVLASPMDVRIRGPPKNSGWLNSRERDVERKVVSDGKVS